MSWIFGAKIEHSDVEGPSSLGRRNEHIVEPMVGPRFRHPCLVHKERRINDPGFGGKN